MRRIILNVTLFMLLTTSAFAQTELDRAGHWEGAVHAPRMEVLMEIDLLKNSKGVFAGTYNQPENALKGLPISSVAISGQSITFVLKANASEPATFSGEFSEDGYFINGTVNQLGYDFPFSLKWTGPAQVTAVPKNAAIGKELEGTWNGSLESDGMKKRLVLKMSNQTDGTAVGSVMSPDGSGIEISIGIKQSSRNVTIDVPSIGASFSGELNAEGTEMTGTWTQAAATLSVTFRKAAQ